LINEVSAKLENKRITVGTFFDLSKAFDTIDHSILLDKLLHYGIWGTANKWFTNYLSNQKQYVQIGNIKSSQLWKSVPPKHLLFYISILL